MQPELPNSLLPMLIQVRLFISSATLTFLTNAPVAPKFYSCTACKLAGNPFLEEIQHCYIHKQIPRQKLGFFLFVVVVKRNSDVYV